MQTNVWKKKRSWKVAAAAAAAAEEEEEEEEQQQQIRLKARLSPQNWPAELCRQQQYIYNIII